MTKKTISNSFVVNTLDDVEVYELIPSSNVVTLDSDGIPKFDVIYFVLQKTVSSAPPVAYTTVGEWKSGSYSLYYVIDGVEHAVDDEYPDQSDSTRVNYHDIEYLYENYHDVLWLVKKNNNIIARTAIRTVSDGRGRIGRFFYYAQAWESSSVSYIVSDAQAPYFSYNNQYWVFNPESNGTYTMQQMGAPSSENKNWQIMANDFKYIITEALFGKYAHLGAFIVNEDFFLSQHGTLFYNNNGTITQYKAVAWDATHSQKAYTYFSSDDPMVSEMPESGKYKFRPTKCVNARTGAEWMAEGNMSVSSDGDMIIKGALMYHKMYRSIPTSGNINLFEGATATTIKLKCDIFMLYGAHSTNAQIQLPPAKFFAGAHIKIINGTYSKNGNYNVSDPSIITLSVYHSNETEPAAKDVYDVLLNSMAVSAPCKQNGDETMAFYDYYTELVLAPYSSIELVSAPNWYHNPTNPQYYVWHLVDAR